MEILPGTVRHDLAERNGMARTFATKFRSAVRKRICKYRKLRSYNVKPVKEECAFRQVKVVPESIIKGNGSQCSLKRGNGLYDRCPLTVIKMRIVEYGGVI